jgi:hypothetical protein
VTEKSHLGKKAKADGLQCVVNGERGRLHWFDPLLCRRLENDDADVIVVVRRDAENGRFAPGPNASQAWSSRVQ